ncbi:MAG: glycosyltransferase [Candidatus Paceibacterota bacterium]|jgi:glycosyltransferase involved in cell wall biosynthesis
MKVLMISGDKNLLKEGSEARARLELQRIQVDQLDVFVWPQIHSWRDIFIAEKKNQYDVVTAQDPFWRGLLAWHVARRAGAKLNLQVHTDLSAQSLFRRSLARFLLRRADSVRVVSEKIKKQVEGIRDKGLVYVLPIFVDISRFKNLELKPHSQKTILWIGRFEPEKDPLSAVQVLKEVQASGIDAKLSMLGTGSLERVVRRAARDLPVDLLGWQDPAAYLQTADVVLCTSRHESWGASMIEALAAGVPVVAPDVGAAEEAGAFVVDRNQLASKVVVVLQQGTRGTLLLNLPTAEEWAKHWRETLV